MGITHERITQEHRAGLTLVEVLTVMAIIAVLAGLLFPVIASARRAAKASASLQNLLQLHVAFSLYRDQHEGGGAGPSALGLPSFSGSQLFDPKVINAESLWKSPCGFVEDGGGVPPSGPGYITPYYFHSNWFDYFQRRGDSAVYLVDLHCNPSGTILHSPFVQYRVNLLRLSGEAKGVHLAGTHFPQSNL